MFRTSPKYRKLQLILNNDVPTQTEVRSYLGSSLAQVFNDYCHETARELLGIVPPLKGPPEELWISPSDQLVGKVALKPPFTNKCIKAVTHQGILEIGEDAGLRFEEETKEKLRQIMEEEMMENRKMFEAEKRRAIRIAVQDISRQYEKHIECLNKSFTKQLKTTLCIATKKSQKEMKKAVMRERMEVEMAMMKKLRDEVSRVVVSLHEECQQSLRAQRDNMVADFNAIMRRERKKVDATIKCYDRKKALDMLAQRCEFETQNMAETAMILCTERMRCSSEKHAIHQSFEKQIEALQKLLLESRKTMEEDKNGDDNLNDEAEDRQFFQVVEIVDKDGKLWKPFQLEPQIPQLDCTEEESMLPIVSSEINFFPPDQYTDRISEASAQSLHSYDSLPFCYFEDKLYVRADYREKSQGQEINHEETKTMTELADGSRFIMELKRSKSCLRNRPSP